MYTMSQLSIDSILRLELDVVYIYLLCNTGFMFCAVNIQNNSLTILIRKDDPIN